MLVATYITPPVNPHSLVSCTHGSILFLIVISSSNETSNIIHHFNPNNHEINYEGDAYPAAGAIQLTLNERDKDMSGKTGRAAYTESLHLWDNASGNLADFTTHFSFVISTANISSPITGGDGLAFFLVPNGSHIPPNTEGAGLGLGHSLASNNQTTNSTGPPFVAVEFDTFVNQWDSDTGAHIVNHLHATALSFNSTNIGPQLNAEIVAEGDAHVSPEGIQLTPNEMNTSQSHAAG
ncbi:hypothetical protein LOK49_LG12G00926 [Camellia lanceoleosa]|uniref:Uncharacterized protein n=1 Tax=Camellia lanceoleosa TaxID=1840588 RepID=A0ACC0FQY5_9ERIC|nr:hypothetical protein LOK49_LG12G00926 [Camellia lanceoleosa]